MEKEVNLLLSTTISKLKAMQNLLLESTRQQESQRLKSLALLCHMVENRQSDLDKIWDLLDEVITGDPIDDEEIVSERLLSD